MTVQTVAATNLGEYIMESRLKKSLNAGGRQDRASEDASRRAPEEKFITSQERRKMWSDGMMQTALPTPPNIDGWHVCWLSTTNSYDSIDKRLRLGYVPVKADEIRLRQLSREVGRACWLRIVQRNVASQDPYEHLPRHYAALSRRTPTGRSRESARTSGKSSRIS